MSVRRAWINICTTSGGRFWKIIGNLITWFSGRLGSARLMVGLHLWGLFQPKWFWDCHWQCLRLCLFWWAVQSEIYWLILQWRKCFPSGQDRGNKTERKHLKPEKKASCSTCREATAFPSQNGTGAWVNKGARRASGHSSRIWTHPGVFLPEKIAVSITALRKQQDWGDGRGVCSEVLRSSIYGGGIMKRPRSVKTLALGLARLVLSKAALTCPKLCCSLLFQVNKLNDCLAVT